MKIKNLTYKQKLHLANDLMDIFSKKFKELSEILEANQWLENLNSQGLWDKPKFLTESWIRQKGLEINNYK